MNTFIVTMTDTKYIAGQKLNIFFIQELFKMFLQIFCTGL